MFHPSLSFREPIIESSDYLVTIAKDVADFDELYRLRYQVFNIEMQAGSEEADATQKDTDKYDQHSSHLIVRHKKHNKIIATYRMQTYAMARANVGFCGSDRYDFAKFPLEVQKQGLSVSRACMAKPYRNSKVFFLLWQGLALILYENRLRYYFGCTSVPTTDTQQANDLVKLLKTMDVYHDQIYIPALPQAKCPYVDKPVDITSVYIPPLFNLYLRFKCLVCSEPCFHKGFRSIEFMILHDTAKLSERHYRMFLGDRKRLF